MTDIVERLRDANDELITFGNDFSDPLLDAANEIEALRQRVKELDELSKSRTITKLYIGALEELAALKQSQAIPDGYVLVPMEPTDDILSCIDCLSIGTYKAILNAAQKQGGQA